MSENVSTYTTIPARDEPPRKGFSITNVVAKLLVYLLPNRPSVPLISKPEDPNIARLTQYLDTLRDDRVIQPPMDEEGNQYFTNNPFRPRYTNQVEDREGLETSNDPIILMRLIGNATKSLIDQTNRMDPSTTKFHAGRPNRVTLPDNYTTSGPYGFLGILILWNYSENGKFNTQIKTDEEVKAFFQAFIRGRPFYIYNPNGYEVPQEVKRAGSLTPYIIKVNAGPKNHISRGHVPFFNITVYKRGNSKEPVLTIKRGMGVRKRDRNTQNSNLDNSTIPTYAEFWNLQGPVAAHWLPLLHPPTINSSQPLTDRPSFLAPHQEKQQMRRQNQQPYKGQRGSSPSSPYNTYDRRQGFGAR